MLLTSSSSLTSYVTKLLRNTISQTDLSSFLSTTSEQSCVTSQQHNLAKRPSTQLSKTRRPPPSKQGKRGQARSSNTHAHGSGHRINNRSANNPRSVQGTNRYFLVVTWSDSLSRVLLKQQHSIAQGFTQLQNRFEALHTKPPFSQTRLDSVTKSTLVQE